MTEKNRRDRRLEAWEELSLLEETGAGQFRFSQYMQLSVRATVIIICNNYNFFVFKTISPSIKGKTVSVTIILCHMDLIKQGSF